MEGRAIAADASAEAETGAFRERCEHWYRAHVDNVLAFQALRATPP